MSDVEAPPVPPPQRVELPQECRTSFLNECPSSPGLLLGDFVRPSGPPATGASGCKGVVLSACLADVLIVFRPEQVEARRVAKILKAEQKRLRKAWFCLLPRRLEMFELSQAKTVARQLSESDLLSLVLEKRNQGNQ